MTFFSTELVRQLHFGKYNQDLAFKTYGFNLRASVICPSSIDLISFSVVKQLFYLNSMQNCEKFFVNTDTEQWNK